MIQNFTHRLNWQRGFKPTECFYENELRIAGNKDGETQFVFSKLCYEEEVVEKEKSLRKSVKVNILYFPIGLYKVCPISEKTMTTSV